MIRQGKAGHVVRKVVLHCAAINTGQFLGWSPDTVRDEITRWHRQRGFSQIGYHGLIMPSGVYVRGRPFSTIGAHVIGHNAGSLGFLLVESRMITHIGAFDDWFTSAQDKVLRCILDDLRHSHGIREIVGHNDLAGRLCPGFRVSEWLPREVV